MTTEHQRPDGSEQTPAERSSDAVAAADAEARADLREDRRRQQDLDYAEFGGES